MEDTNTQDEAVQPRRHRMSAFAAGKAILEALHTGPATQKELCKALHLGNHRVHLAILRLQRKGWVEKRGWNWQVRPLQQVESHEEMRAAASPPPRLFEAEAAPEAYQPVMQFAKDAVALGWTVVMSTDGSIKVTKE